MIYLANLSGGKNATLIFRQNNNLGKASGIHFNIFEAGSEPLFQGSFFFFSMHAVRRVSNNCNIASPNFLNSETT